jgi:hypothetical protein
VLNPIDTEAVIRDGGAVGRFPGEIHEGVAWWLGACFVTITATARLAAGSDGRPATHEFFRRLCNGAINAHHHACHVAAIPGIAEDVFLAYLQRHDSLPGAYVTSARGTDGGAIVRIRLYDSDGQPLREGTGLERIRRMIAEDRVPIPVSDSAKGTIQPLSPDATQATA